MPRLIMPSLPPEVDVAIAHMGNRAQADILRHLAKTGPSTVGELMEGVDMTRPSLNRHLAALESAGIVHTTPPAGSRHGRTVIYSIDLQRVRHLATEYLRYVSGQ